MSHSFPLQFLCKISFHNQLSEHTALICIYKYKLIYYELVLMAQRPDAGPALDTCLTLMVVSGRFKAAASSHLRGLDT